MAGMMWIYLRSYIAFAKSMLDTILCRLCSDVRVKPVNLTGRNVIVTGGNSGIGYECALKLASFGANVVIACRDQSKAESARASLVALTGNENVRVLTLDVSSFESIKAFVASWGSESIDILINNAGQPPKTFLLTDEGYESSYVVNFLSQVLLTELLLPSFAPNGRIIMMSSILNYFGRLKPNDLDLRVSTSRKLKVGSEMKPASICRDLYSNAKLSQIVYTRELQARLDASAVYATRKLVIHACHPGAVNSPIWDKTVQGDARFDRFAKAVNLVGISPEQGSCTPVWLATDPQLSTNGGYYYDRQARRTPHWKVEDAALRGKLWIGWHAQCGLPASI